MVVVVAGVAGVAGGGWGSNRYTTRGLNLRVSSKYTGREAIRSRVAPLNHLRVVRCDLLRRRAVQTLFAPLLGP